jgi:UDP-2,3-diacylglucosamine pyrophosphatase LpxH
MTTDRLSFRSVFVSDLHLGSAACHTERIRQFLSHTECENLYLVGDIVDVWVGAQSWKWKQAHTNVIRTILGKATGGCMVRYTPGNHDGLCRKLCGAELGNIHVGHFFVHTTADGRRLLVVHGDIYDRTVTAFKPLAWVGAWCYEFLTVTSTWLNAIFGGRGPGSLDLAARAKHRIKSFFEYVTSFQERITVDAHRQGFDGVVCGHVHGPLIAHHDCGALYVNTGDWVSHCSAVVEHWDGQLELIHWDDVAELCAGEPYPPMPAWAEHAGR